MQLSKGDEYNAGRTGRGENGKGIMRIEYAGVLNSHKIKSKQRYQIRKVEHFWEFVNFMLPKCKMK